MQKPRENPKISHTETLILFLLCYGKLYDQVISNLQQYYKKNDENVVINVKITIRETLKSHS